MARHNGGTGGSNRKHHIRKRGMRNRSNYPARLAARGLTSRSVHMRTLEDLRKRAERREREAEENQEFAQDSGENS